MDNDRGKEGEWGINGIKWTKEKRVGGVGGAGSAHGHTCGHTCGYTCGHTCGTHPRTHSRTRHPNRRTGSRRPSWRGWPRRAVWRKRGRRPWRRPAVRREPSSRRGGHRVRLVPLPGNRGGVCVVGRSETQQWQQDPRINSAPPCTCTSDSIDFGRLRWITNRTSALLMPMPKAAPHVVAKGSDERRRR